MSLLSSLIETCRKSELLRNTSVLIYGTVIAQLIPILLQPFLRRFFSPESYGIYSVYTSLLGILIVLTSLRYEQAIVLPKNDKNAANLVALSLFSTLIFSIIVLLVAVVGKNWLLRLLNIPDAYSFVLLALPLGLLFYAIIQVFNYWLIRKKAFVGMSINKIARRGVEGITWSSFALKSNGNGLIIGDLFGQFANVIVSFLQSVKHGFSFRQVRMVKIKYVAHRFIEFPKYNLIPAFLSACSFLLPAILINKHYSAEYAGFFDLSKMLLSIPMALIASSVSSVLLQRVAEQFQKKQSFLTDIKLVGYTVGFIGIVEISVILLFGVKLFAFVFGEEWIFSGQISKILVWSYVLNFLFACFSSIFIAMRKVKIYGFWQIFYFVAILSLTFFKMYDFDVFIKIYVAIEIVCYLVAIILLVSVVSRYEFSLKKI